MMRCWMVRTVGTAPAGGSGKRTDEFQERTLKPVAVMVARRTVGRQHMALARRTGPHEREVGRLYRSGHRL